MVNSKVSGWILPRGGYKEGVDTSWEDCAHREAMEEGGFKLGPLTELGKMEGVNWFSGLVKKKLDPTDPEWKQTRSGAEKRSVEAAKGILGDGSAKKLGMSKALEEALEKELKVQ
ncbi:hypothetical protein PpBr36_03815 [Pyricularia pennisetigena]|uniref:hypothetical protein n=1 Tax=Pyricularia pennisetigena TaxID=1578925 RepID=UPI0011517BE3|nr:hypothetical protein PpBr36_03815 [Pyricularia pennisetigena]TLS31102.1 hypothetical protein PpBr36_03815 [Pyricularia pennisetigena]